MMASRRGHVKDTSHDSDGEESTMSDVISPRDERANRRARDSPSAEPTTETLEVRVKGQNGVNEVVASNSDATSQERHQDFTSGQLEHYLVMGLVMKGFWEGEPEDQTTTGLHSG